VRLGRTLHNNTTRRDLIFPSKCTTALSLAILMQELWLCANPGAQAGELDGFGGQLASDTNGDGTYTWGLEYREPLSDHWNAGFVWLNEGHQPHNHRDGQAVQLWWHTQADPLGLVFAAGLGPYRFYDTHLLDADPGYDDKHGWGALASFAAQWYFTNRWFVFLRLNQAEAVRGFDSTSAALGVGYRFADLFNGAAGERRSAPTPWEVDGLFGERIQNSANSKTGLAESVDLRRQLSDHFAVSASVVAGQETNLEWGAGFAAELWLEQHLTSRFMAGAGAGAFVVSSDDNLSDSKIPSNLEVVVSITLSYAITPHWAARALWHRIGTGDDHDADIVLVGAGYSF
jgi:hypothetical protein